MGFGIGKTGVEGAVAEGRGAIWLGGGGATGMAGRGLLCTGAGVGSGIGIGEGAVVGRGRVEGRRSSWWSEALSEKGGEGPSGDGAFSECKMTLSMPCLRPKAPRTG